MNCKKTRDLIDGYIDGELDAGQREEVRLHLNSCPRCREVEEGLRLSVIGPLRSAAAVKAPEGLWRRIKTTLEAQPQKRPLADLAGLIFLPLRGRRPAFVLAGLAAVMIIAAILTRLSFSPVNTFLTEQAQFVSQLSKNGIASEFAIDDVNLGTAIEKYFL